MGMMQHVKNSGMSCFSCVESLRVRACVRANIRQGCHLCERRPRRWVEKQPKRESREGAGCVQNPFVTLLKISK